MNLAEYRTMYEVEDGLWWYLGMRSTMLDLLRAHLPNTPGRRPRILDAGCGTGGMLLRLLTVGDAVGVDLSPEAIAFCRERGLGPEQAWVGSLEALPFADASFDAVVSLDVLCDLPDDRRGFAELARVLRPGGTLLLNLPAFQRLRSEHDIAVNNVRRYTRRGVRQRLGEVGLQPVRLSYANTFLLPPAVIVRLARRFQPDYSHKSAHREAARSDLTPPPAPINRLLTEIFLAEGRLLQHIDLPVGLSVVAVARKPGQGREGQG